MSAFLSGQSQQQRRPNVLNRLPAALFTDRDRLSSALRVRPARYAHRRPDSELGPRKLGFRHKNTLGVGDQLGQRQEAVDRAPNLLVDDFDARVP